MDIGQAFQELQTLNVEDLGKIGTAPRGVRIFVIILAMAIVLGLGAWLLIVPKLDLLKATEDRELVLRTTFNDEQKKAANLDAYRAQLDEMTRSFGVMLRQLPNKIDIESLLIDLSQTSVAAGLEVEFLKPEAELQEEFYAKYPIKLNVTGGYHQFGNFVSGLAALPRIVTLHDIGIAPLADAPARLKMELTATTYRYLDEDAE
ncbi:MAG: type 4a pilus biogenesis protein PilO [Pseudomonadota bacterium]